MKPRKLVPFLLFVISILVPAIAYASGSVFDSSACNTLNIVTGTPGKVFAAFAIVSTGVGFFTGKISWGLMIGVVGGIAVIFGAPSLVSVISGKPMFECQQGVQYVSDCSGASCYSCPMGFTGEDCDECRTGYQGINCDSCADGYTGYNCSECDALEGYYSSGSYCFKACAVSFTGISPGTVVQPTSGLEKLDCDDTGFDGFINYSCIGEVFEAAPGEVCGCEGNRGGVNCDECQTGYDISSDCTTLLSGYYDTTEGPQPECDVSSEVVVGIDFSSVSTVLPLDGSIGCLNLGYDKQISYTCKDGNFGYTGACECAPGYDGGLADCAASCDVANHYERDVATGTCKKGCDISIPGLTDIWVDLTTVEEVKICDSTNFQGDLVYECDPDNAGFEIIEDNCECKTGYSGTDCLSCDAANGYSDDGTGLCVAGCTIDIKGSSAIWVSPTTSTLQVPCDETNFEGNINYTCDNNTFSTSDSCTCETGFDLTNDCLTCDTTNGYQDDGSGNCVAGCDITGIDSLITDSWVSEGNSSLTCQTAADGFTRNLGVNCSANSVSITSTNTSCTCATGYTGATCATCDSANGYSSQGGVCKSGCYVNMDGIAANYWVNLTTSTSQLSCNIGNYTGTINYSCDGSAFSTSDTCGCDAGYTLSSGCSACDSANNYNLMSGSCQKSCAVSTSITDMQVPSSGFVVQGSGTLSCNASSTSGRNNRSGIDYNCDGSGNFSTTETTCVCDAGYTGTDCSSIDSANGYVDDGSGNPVMSCDVSLAGISETSVVVGASSLTCNVGNYEGSVSYNCDSNRNLNASGSCGCMSGYTGTNCASCSTGYDMVSGSCKQECTITSQTGVTDGTKVKSGSSSFNCDSSGYQGNITYTCTDGSLSGVTNNCEPESCSGGSEIDVGVNEKVHIFTSNDTLSCTRVIDNVQILVVGGGGSGGDHPSATGEGGPGGGGGGGVAYVPNVTLKIANYSVTIGNGGVGVASNGACSGLGVSGGNSMFRKTGSSAIDIRGYGGGAGNGCGAMHGLSGGSSGGSNGGVAPSPTRGYISGASGTLMGNKGGSTLSGGGGATSVGISGSDSSGSIVGGNGGNGFTSSISGSSEVYGSGGGAAGYSSAGSGGTNAGNGHVGINNTRSSNIDGVANKGGGGGSSGRNDIRAGDGGSGVVIVRYAND